MKFCKKNFESEFCSKFWFYKKTQFNLKTWCVVKMLIQHLTSCKNFHQQNDELWKRWLEDSLVMKTLVQKLFSILVFFLRFILFEEALNCHLWNFYCLVLQKKFRKWVLQQILIFIKKNTIQLENLMRCKNVDSTSDTLWKFSFKTDDLRRSWLIKTLVSIFWFKNCLLIQIFSQISSL